MCVCAHLVCACVHACMQHACYCGEFACLIDLDVCLYCAYHSFGAKCTLGNEQTIPFGSAIQLRVLLAWSRGLAKLHLACKGRPHLAATPRSVLPVMLPFPSACCCQFPDFSPGPPDAQAHALLPMASFAAYTLNTDLSCLPPRPPPQAPPFCVACPDAMDTWPPMRNPSCCAGASGRG